MTDELHTLEQHLLQDPFDADARARYARLLRERQRPADALAQLRLLLKQQPSADAHLHAALCCKQLADADATRTHVASARACADFDPNDARLDELGVSEEPVRLRVVAGAKRDAGTAIADVVSITRASKVRFSDVVGMRDLKQVLKLRSSSLSSTRGCSRSFEEGGRRHPALRPARLRQDDDGARDRQRVQRQLHRRRHQRHSQHVGSARASATWRAVREGARRSPAVLFFDELDALAFARNKASSDVSRTLVNEFLKQLDGFARQNDQVLMLAATNMPWDVDEAMKRPGRFDRQVFVPPPDSRRGPNHRWLSRRAARHDRLARLARLPSTSRVPTSTA